MRPWLGLLLTACGALPSGGPEWPAEPRAHVAPLAVAGAEAPLILPGAIDGSGPYLFLLDREYPGAALTREAAAGLTLPGGGDPARGRTIARVARLDLGTLQLRDVPFTVVDVTEFDALHGRAVVGVLGTLLFDGPPVEIDRAAGVVRWLPAGSAAPPAGDPLLRFPELPRCGAACLSGRVTAVAAGRVELTFEPPSQLLPEGYWWRVDFGRSAARTAIVRVQTTRSRATAVVEAAHLDPASIRPVGSAVNVVDVVSLGARCMGLICTRW